MRTRMCAYAVLVFVVCIFVFWCECMCTRVFCFVCPLPTTRWCVLVGVVVLARCSSLILCSFWARGASHRPCSSVLILSGTVGIINKQLTNQDSKPFSCLLFEPPPTSLSLSDLAWPLAPPLPLPPTSILSTPLPFVSVSGLQHGRTRAVLLCSTRRFISLFLVSFLVFSARKERRIVIHVSKRDQRLQGSQLPLVCLAVVLSSCCLSCALTGPLSFVSPVLSSLSPSLSLSQPDYSSVYGSPPPVELVSFTAVRCWQPSSCLFLSFLSCYAITSLLDMGLFSRRCPLALLTGVSTVRAVILSFPQTSSSFFLSSSHYFSTCLSL